MQVKSINLPVEIEFGEQSMDTTSKILDSIGFEMEFDQESGLLTIKPLEGDQPQEGVGDEEPEAPKEDEEVIIELLIMASVNFRDAPSTQSQVIELLRAGEKVQLIEEVNTYWLKIRDDQGRIGYASPKYTNYKSSPITTPKPPLTAAEIKVNSIIQSGHAKLGIPYKFGAKAGSGFYDCSLFIQTIFKENGVTLGRDSRQQSVAGVYVPFNELRRGDLIFFRSANSTDPRITHVAMYIDTDTLLHTYGEGGVRYSKYSSWSPRQQTARRIIQ